MTASRRPVLTLLTPDPGDAAYGARGRDAVGLYEALFRDAGVTLRPTPWTDPWPADGAALPLLAWGYHKRESLWRSQLEHALIKMINPLSVVRWNTDKHYLAGLAAAGVPTVPTAFVPEADAAALAAAFDRFETDRLVVKPVVSAGSYRTAVVGPGDPVPALAGPVMIQPFLDAVRAEGEISLFYFGGAFSHAARKVAAADDFRVQPQFGGRFTRIEPDVEMTAAARAVLAAAPPGLVYGRIDLIRDRDGALKLMELEAIEPDLYLDLAPDAGPRFAAAVAAALAAGATTGSA